MKSSSNRLILRRVLVPPSPAPPKPVYKQLSELEYPQTFLAPRAGISSKPMRYVCKVGRSIRVTVVGQERLGSFLLPDTTEVQVIGEARGSTNDY